jgi:tetratricopeptide (TPR) repeat protein
MKRFALILAISPLTSLAVQAQHPHHPPATRPAPLFTGLGNHHHPVSTTKPEAQRYFDQGLALIYAFNHEEAARSFRRAAELDPDLAMAWWGIALAVGPNYNEATVDQGRMKAAVEAIGEASARSAKATALEREYIAALKLRFTLEANPDLKKLSTDYKNAMGELVRRHPDDLDAATLYADSLMNLRPWQLWTKEGKPQEGTEEIVAMLERVLRRDPNHLGANHLYIHAVEASRNPERALPSASRLGALAPAAGHLVHMPAHVYIRTGDYEAAASVNEAAAEADAKYIAQTGVQGMYPAMYYSHNLHFLVESYNRIGRFQDAQRAAQRLAENVRPHVKDMPMLEGFLPSSLFVLLRFNRYDEIIASPEPDRSLPILKAIWHYARGVALIGKGQLAAAEQESQTFSASVGGLPGETPFGLNTAPAVLRIADHALKARLAWAKANRRLAIEHWRQAVAAQDALNYDEPPGWYYPVRESLGAALLRNGEAAEAEQVFRADLETNPRSGRSLFGLLESLTAQGKDASGVRREFESAWKKAEVKLKIEDL